MVRDQSHPPAGCAVCTHAQALQTRWDASGDNMQRLRGELAEERAKLREVEAEEREIARKAREKARAAQERVAAAAAAAAAKEVSGLQVLFL